MLGKNNRRRLRWTTTGDPDLDSAFFKEPSTTGNNLVKDYSQDINATEPCEISNSHLSASVNTNDTFEQFPNNNSVTNAHKQNDFSNPPMRDYKAYYKPRETSDNMPHQMMYIWNKDLREEISEKIINADDASDEENKPELIHGNIAIKLVNEIDQKYHSYLDAISQPAKKYRSIYPETDNTTDEFPTIVSEKPPRDYKAVNSQK